MCPAYFLSVFFFNIAIIIDVFHYIPSYCMYVGELLYLEEAKISFLWNEEIWLEPSITDILWLSKCDSSQKFFMCYTLKILLYNY